MAVMDDMEKERHAAGWWAKVAAWTFGVWAAMVPLGVIVLKDALSSTVRDQQHLSTELRAFSHKFDAYVLTAEKRLLLLEERQSAMLSMLMDMRREVSGRAK